MKTLQIINLLLLLSSLASCIPLIPFNFRSTAYISLFKRKGGGGKGGGSSSGGKPSSGSSGSSGKPSGSSSTSSNIGGSTSRGSGPAPAYGGNRFYGGGGAVPYSAGAASSRGLASRGLLPVALVGGIFAGSWLHGAYYYPYSRPFVYRNTTNNRNETTPVICLCEQYSECGCEENTDDNYVRTVVGDGSYAGLNKSLVQVGDVNGTRTIVINGTLPNGTTAAGGEDEGAAGRNGGGGALLGFCVLGGMVALLL